ncbi:hypothetical protein RJ55_02758 [Drechmeria coniospora]|nr:hypothetical protein RJ55_02758 [Drechmeria coniospora]
MDEFFSSQQACCHQPVSFTLGYPAGTRTCTVFTVRVHTRNTYGTYQYGTSTTAARERVEVPSHPIPRRSYPVPNAGQASSCESSYLLRPSFPRTLPDRFREQPTRRPQYDTIAAALEPTGKSAANRPTPLAGSRKRHARPNQHTPRARPTQASGFCPAPASSHRRRRYPSVPDGREGFAARNASSIDDVASTPNQAFHDGRTRLHGKRPIHPYILQLDCQGPWAEPRTPAIVTHNLRQHRSSCNASSRRAGADSTRLVDALPADAAALPKQGSNIYWPRSQRFADSAALGGPLPRRLGLVASPPSPPARPPARCSGASLAWVLSVARRRLIL